MRGKKRSFASRIRRHFLDKRRIRELTRRIEETDDYLKWLKGKAEHAKSQKTTFRATPEVMKIIRGWSEEAEALWNKKIEKLQSERRFLLVELQKLQQKSPRRQ